MKLLFKTKAYRWIKGSRQRFQFAVFISLLSVCTLASAQKNTAAIAMPDEYSAAVAEKVLQDGGNAVDAAVAAAFVLAVTYPEAGNLGGGGFMTLYANETSNFQPKTNVSVDAQQHAYFLDYREKAPKAATMDMYLDGKKQVVPYKSLIGYQASGVPGTVMGLWTAHQRFGSMDWSTLLQPAINYAKKGFIVSADLENTRKWYQKWIANKSNDLNFNHYFSGLKTNVLFKQPELAKTLSRIAEEGADDFYHGQTALALVKQMQAHDGLITMKDLAAYEAKWRKPILENWKDYTVVSAPPPSSGGVALVQLLKMKALLDPEYHRQQLLAVKEGIPAQAYEAHYYAEMEKRVYADRAKYLGDPDFVKVPVSQLVSDDYISRRAQSVEWDGPSDTKAIHPGKIESPETTHFSIVDFNGNAVSNTYTLNMPFGNGVVIEGAGFLMNDEMDDFSSKPGVANVFGVVGGHANAIAPEKRMLSSMTPTILLKGDQVVMAVGTPGGSSIITSVFQTIVNVFDKGMDAQDAVNATRVHHQLFPKDQINYNPSLPKATKDALRLMGYNLRKNNYLGDVQLVFKRQGKWQAASDIRGRGEAKVFSQTADEVKTNETE
ncbi:gamma-glutamyltransferase [Hydrogenovibrio kuenenii]|uniref:gamma-glutamyltransferase n=1 Tax=Hydrogenovibrio kuenenii TaxID=63658 RepID=UPI000465C624|nr:gamma-glutamyltransferase [Hydrogenovibrio kuenenii]